MTRAPYARSCITAAIGLLLVASCGAGSASPPLSFVVIGNSITRHGPAIDIGWNGDWGMAASSAEADYVGQSARLLTSAQGAAPHTRRFTFTALEHRPTAAKADPEMLAAARSSDLLVVELGDNVTAPKIADFGREYAQLLEQAKPASGLLVCMSTWWKSARVDALIETACRLARGTFVDIGDIRRTGVRAPSAGGSSDAGVLSHPGDNDMAEIAERIAAAWHEHALSAKSKAVP